MLLEGKRICALVHHDFEDLELWVPVYRLREEGAVVELVGEGSKVKYKGKYGVPAVSEYSFREALTREYDGLLVPGGWAPDKLRRFPEVLELVKKMDAAEKTIGQICHAGWVLISADILRGRLVTSTPGIRDDMRNAGAEWRDVPAIADGHIVSSRRPPDLPEYCKELIKNLKKS